MSGALKGQDAIIQALTKIKESLSRAQKVDVGFFKNATYDDGTPVASVAAAQEFGSANTPARSFMRTTIAEQSKRWGRGTKAFLKQSDYDAEKALELLGAQASADMVDKIADITEPALSPKTIAAKRRKGSSQPDKPLIDTGRMSNSISYQVDSGDD